MDSDLVMLSPWHLLIFVVIPSLVALIFYLLTLQKALSRVSPRNRLMEPGLVWLLLIPCFNIIWQFIIAVRVPGSLQNEFRARGRDDGSDYGNELAMTNAILGIVGGVFLGIVDGVISSVVGKSQDTTALAGMLSIALGLVQVILFIKFWVRTANYSNQLAMDDGYCRDIGHDPDDDNFDRRYPPKEGPYAPPGSFRPEHPDQYQ